jgi:hypothetical protein
MPIRYRIKIENEMGSQKNILGVEVIDKQNYTIEISERSTCSGEYSKT